MEVRITFVQPLLLSVIFLYTFLKEDLVNAQENQTSTTQETVIANINAVAENSTDTFYNESTAQNVTGKSDVLGSNGTVSIVELIYGNETLYNETFGNETFSSNISGFSNGTLVSSFSIDGNTTTQENLSANITQVIELIPDSISAASNESQLADNSTESLAADKNSTVSNNTGLPVDRGKMNSTETVGIVFPDMPYTEITNTTKKPDAVGNLTQEGSIISAGKMQTSETSGMLNVTESVPITAGTENGTKMLGRSEHYGFSVEGGNGTWNSTERSPANVTMLFIPYVTDIGSKTENNSGLTETLDIMNVTVGSRSGFVKDMDMEEPATNEVLEPDDKKLYEDLSAEEKENIVTVVFNQLSGNWTLDLEQSFSSFVSKVMTEYLKIWSTVKEPENELVPGLERAQVMPNDIRYLKPTPYFSKDLTVAMVTFYITTSSSTSAKSTILPAEIVVENLKAMQQQLQKKLRLNTTDMIIGVHPSFGANIARNESQFISQHEPLFVALIAVTGTCLGTLLIAVIWFKCQQKRAHYKNSDREKLHKEIPHFMRGQDLNPEHEILREERLQTAEKDSGRVANGDKKYLVHQNGDNDGWMVPIGDVPFEDLNAPAIQDTRL